jgi:hypothetical protein
VTGSEKPAKSGFTGNGKPSQAGSEEVEPAEARNWMETSGNRFVRCHPANDEPFGLEEYGSLGHPREQPI